MRRLPELLIFPLGALACALVSNALAGPERRLAWGGRPPEAVSPAAPASPAPATIPPSNALPLTPARSSAKEPAPSRAPAKPAATPVPQAAAFTPSSPFPDIDSEEAWRAHQGGARFLDARRSADYRAGHIAGAWSLPVWESDLEARLTTFEAGSAASYGDLLVLYCGGGDCQDSHLLAGKLLALGYRHLRIYRDGFPDWVAQGRPVRAGVAR